MKCASMKLDAIIVLQKLSSIVMMDYFLIMMVIIFAN